LTLARFTLAPLTLPRFALAPPKLPRPAPDQEPPPPAARAPPPAARAPPPPARAPPPPPRPPLWHTSGTPVPSGAVAVMLRPMLPLQAAAAAGAWVATNPTKAIGAM